MLSSRNISSHGAGRPRSGTLEEKEPRSAPGRPSHIRSHSYLSPLSPADPKLRNSSILSSESKGSISNGKDGRGTADQAIASSTTYVIPKIHFPGHSSRHKGSQDSRSGSIAATDGENGQTRQPSQLQLQHLGLHLPVSVKRATSHRHTRSELPRSSVGEDKMANDGLLHPNAAQIRGESMLTRMASNLSSRAGGSEAKSSLHKPHHQHSSSDINRMNTNTSEFLGYSSRPGLRRRATSDPRAPQYAYSRSGAGIIAAAQAQYGEQPHLEGIPGSPAPIQRAPMSEFDILFYKAEKARRDKETNVKEADVQKLTMEVAESNVELQGQLANADQSARGMMRRLDYAHDTLVRTSTSLVDTISSFQNLCEQSDKLIKNFETRTSRLDKDMRATLSRHRKALLESRGKKIADLEARSKAATERAEEMSRRLENCRTMVKNFTEREQTKRKAWKGVIMGSIWGCGFILLGVLLGLALWWYNSYGNIARHDLHDVLTLVLSKDGAHGGQIRDLVRENARHQQEVLQNVPPAVRNLLEDIAQRNDRNEHQKVWVSSTYTETASGSLVRDDKQLEKIFEKLEL